MCKQKSNQCQRDCLLVFFTLLFYYYDCFQFQEIIIQNEDVCGNWTNHKMTKSGFVNFDMQVSIHRFAVPACEDTRDIKATSVTHKYLSIIYQNKHHLQILNKLIIIVILVYLTLIIFSKHPQTCTAGIKFTYGALVAITKTRIIFLERTQTPHYNDDNIQQTAFIILLRKLAYGKVYQNDWHGTRYFR